MIIKYFKIISNFLLIYFNYLKLLKQKNEASRPLQGVLVDPIKPVELNRTGVISITL